MKTAMLILAIEILLPGGTLLALALLAYRRRKNLLQPLSIPMSIRWPAIRLWV
jgi:hypothetical protein